MIEKYGVTGYSEIEHCVTKETETFKIDALDWFCLGVIITIFGLVYFGTGYDLRLRAKGGFNPEHFRKYPYSCK